MQSTGLGNRHIEKACSHGNFRYKKKRSQQNIDIFFFGGCRFFLDFLKIIIMGINVIHQLLIFS